MCGRFVITTPVDQLRMEFSVSEPSIATIPASYNVAPAQPIAAVISRGEGRSLSIFRWGLVPSWADDPKIGMRMINARSEGVDEKPAFRSAFRHRRCLIPADGFYEWLKQGGEKFPFYFRRDDDAPLALAGLWEVNEKGDAPLTTCTILTTEANALMEPIHDRMPVILPRDDYDQWLDPEAEPEGLLPLLRPYEGGDLARYPVSKRVNSARNDGPDLIEPLPDAPLSPLDNVPDEETKNSA